MTIIDLFGGFAFICLAIMLLLNMAGARQKQPTTTPKAKQTPKPSSKRMLQPTAKKMQTSQQSQKKQQSNSRDGKKNTQKQQHQGARLNTQASSPTNRGGDSVKTEMTLAEKIEAYKRTHPKATTQEAFKAVRNS